MTRQTPSRRPEVRVHTAYALPRSGIPAAVSFRTWVVAALDAAGHRGAAEVSIRVVDGDEGRGYNRDYRSRDYATNVLSFPADLAPELGLALLGDLLICAPVVEREARDQGKRVRDHYAHLTVHGILHLLGHDHQDQPQADRMEALEVHILASLGIPDPYESGTQGPSAA